MEGIANAKSLGLLSLYETNKEVSGAGMDTAREIIKRQMDSK